MFSAVFLMCKMKQENEAAWHDSDDEYISVFTAALDRLSVKGAAAWLFSLQEASVVR